MTDAPTDAPQKTDVPLIRDRTIGGRSPFDGVPLDPVPCTDVAALGSIVAAARKAHETFASLEIRERARRLALFRDAILSRADAFADVLRRECGKLETEIRLFEVLPTADLAAYWCDEGPDLLAAEEPELDPISYPGKTARIERIPRGVVALITPWNFPLAIPLRTIFPALLAGNAVVLKPSEWSPRSGALIAEAAREAFGADLLQVVQGGGDVGAALIGSGVDAVVFTGSVGTGKKIAHAAAEALIPCGLELGGKDAAIVLDDANIERAANGIAWAGFMNAGQNCASVERVIVTQGVYEAFRGKLLEAARGIELGRDLGPLTTPHQLRVVERHVEDARNQDADVLVGGARVDRPGLWFAPTVLEIDHSDAQVLREETFGPVLPLVCVRDEEEAIGAANDCRFGLTASVWTRDLERGETVARRLRAGVVTINNHAFSGAIPSLPWTGVGESGYGVTSSPHTLDVLTRPRAILVDASRGKRELWWYPYTPSLLRIAKAMTDLRNGKAGVGRKIRAVFSLLGAFVRRWKA